MSKSTGKKSIAKSRVNASKEEMTSSSGHDEEKIGRVLKSRQLNLEQEASTAGLGLNEDVEIKQSGLKRSYDDDDDGDDDVNMQYGTEINGMLQKFSLDMAKAVIAKKKRVESFTVGSMKASLKMVVEPWQNQLTSSVELANEMYKLVMPILDQADTDIVQMKDHDEKMIKMFQQQMKASAVNRNAMIQRTAACRQVMESFMTKVKEHDTQHRDELKTMQYDLKKELSTLQKKMLNDGQKEEIENVKKNLTKMYYMSAT